MNYKLPRVGMIYLKGNSVSEYYKNIVSQSWLNAGFGIDYIQGITPETFDEAPVKLNFGKKSTGRNIGKDFTETEKAIWYSHIKMWDIAARKQNPLIVIEHDVMLLDHIDKVDIERYPILGICHNGLLSKKPEKGYRVSAGGAYMLKNDIAKKMIDELPSLITTNSDAYIHNYIARYGTFKQRHSTQLYLPDIGTTIAHD
jgi:hypothetical protein